MKRIIQYQYIDNGTLKISNEPLGNPDFLDCVIKYKLRAEEGKILLNKKTGYTSKFCVIFPSELSDWEEIAY